MTAISPFQPPEPTTTRMSLPPIDTAESPCINVCVIDVDGTCRGCYRTLDEVARWSRMSDAERRETNRLCGQRRRESKSSSH